jgi:hypothetical protein
MNKEFLKIQKIAGLITESQYNQKINLLENQTPSDVEEFLDDMINASIPEDSNEGETVEDMWDVEEYGDEEAYGEAANAFNKAHSYIESQGGTITIPGNPDVKYTSMPDGSIKYSLVVTLSEIEGDPDDYYGYNEPINPADYAEEGSSDKMAFLANAFQHVWNMGKGNNKIDFEDMAKSTIEDLETRF